MKNMMMLAMISFLLIVMPHYASATATIAGDSGRPQIAAQPQSVVSASYDSYLDNGKEDHFLDNGKEDHFLDNDKDDHFHKHIGRDRDKREIHGAEMTPVGMLLAGSFALMAFLLFARRRRAFNRG